MCALAPSGLTQLAAAGGPVHVRFQLGLFREEVRVPAGNLSYRHAKRLAAEVIERKVSRALRVQIQTKTPKWNQNISLNYLLEYFLCCQFFPTIIKNYFAS